MVRYLFVASALAFSAQRALAVAEWGQCGGLNWTGSTTCDAGLTCVYQNDWYYQCLRVSSSATASSTSKTSSSSMSSSTSSTRASSSTSSSKSSTITSSSKTSSTSASSSTKAPSSSVSSCAAAQTYTGTLPVYPQQPTGLSTLMKPHGRYVGISYDGTSTYITDTAYTDIVFGNAAQLTPENSFKWGSIEVTEGDFDSNALWADRMAELAPANCLTLRGHTLIWHQQLPTWITSGSWTNATLQAAIVEHVTGEMTKFKGQIHTWDVVNEVIGDDANMRASIFYTTIGETYIDLAFKTAKSVDTVPILAINDYNIESASSKSTAMVNLVTRLKSRGAPVEQVGIQGHLIVGSVSSAMATQWNAYTALGVSVAVTELDIRMTLPATDALLAQQAKDYVTVFTACLAVSACKGVTLWGASDKYSWVPASFSGQGSACLWDENYAAKPAYTAVQNYLASA